MKQTVKITESQTLNMVSKIVETASNGKIVLPTEQTTITEGTAKPKKQRVVKITESEYKTMIEAIAKEKLQVENEVEPIEEEVKFDFGVDFSKYL